MLKVALADVTKMLARMEIQGIGSAVREEQLQALRKNLLREQAAIFKRMGKIIEARRLEAAERAIVLGSAVDTALLEAAGRTDEAKALRDVALRASEETLALAETRVTSSRIPLAERIYRNEVWMNGRLEDKINSALLRGLPAREFAAEARDWFSPSTPGGIRYAAMRLARTEINNAYHATSIHNAHEKPWINQMKWHLSRSHPKPDLCDRFAKGGRDGDGVYDVRDVPRKPHPHCFCFVTPIPPEEDAFLDALVAGRYDGYLRSKGLGSAGPS